MAGLADLGNPDSPIIIDIEGPDKPLVHPDGTIETPTGDGGVVISFNGTPPDAANDAENERFGANLAAKLSADRSSVICEQLLEQIEADAKSRSEWITQRARAIELLGFKIEDPKADVGSSSTPMEGMSTIYDPLLSESVLRATATAIGELLPSEGPVKIQNSGRGTAQTEGQAEALEKDMNYWLTSVAKEYYPDTKRMLFLAVLGGSGFKKGFHCPIKRRPTIESVDAADVIVSSEATDMHTAARVTQRISMRQSLLRRMQVVGAYQDIPLAPPSQQPKNEAKERAESTVGVKTGYERPEDTPYELYETYAEIDIDEFAPKHFKGKRVQLPYKVTIEKESRCILELRRDWKQDDDRCLRKRTWVKYPYIEALGFYCLGMMHLVGNLSLALTAGEREGLDAGMMANFPGLLIARWAARQQQGNTNMRIYAGEAGVVDTGERPIGDAVMGVPYRDVTAGLLGIIQALTEKGQRLAGTADLPVGEGKQDAPVGTTIALIEQATKIESAVHKGMHTAQSEEFQILERLFREDPESFWADNPDATINWDEGTFLAALRNTALVPKADPNTPSHIHRLLKAMGLKQLQAQNPTLYDAREVDKRILEGMGWQDVDDLFVKPPPPGTPPPPPDPTQVMAQAKMQDSQTKAQKVVLDAQAQQQEASTKAQQLAMEGEIQDKEIAKELIIHSGDRADAARSHALDQSGHALDALTAGHEAGLGQAQHLLDVHQALNPPPPPPSPGAGGAAT